MKRIHLYIIPAFILLLAACEKEITVEMPEYQEKVVVEGTIEDGMPPLVFLSWSSAYFDPVDASSYANSFIHNANVTMTTAQGTTSLNELCTSNLPPGLDTIVAEFLGIPIQQLAALPICAYTTTDTAYWGKVGQHYRLTVDVDTVSLSAYTKIPEKVALDSLWWEAQGAQDSIGFIYATLSDPDSIGNAYRWWSRRLTTNEDGNPEDPAFIPPFGSVFDDEFFNGSTFDFAYNRPGSEFDSEDDEPGYFRPGDTVVIKFGTCTLPVMNFYQSMEGQAASQGSPFASPSNIQSNIEGGGLGVWAGFGVTYDTLICQ